MAADVQSRLLSADEIVTRLQRIATTDVLDFMTWATKTNTVTLKNPKEIAAELAQCIESITQHETQHARYRSSNSVEGLRPLDDTSFLVYITYPMYPLKARADLWIKNADLDDTISDG